MRHSPARPILATAAIAVAILVAACGSAAAPVPSERPATPLPTVGAPTPPTVTPAPVTPSPAPVDPAPVRPTPNPTPKPKPTPPPANPRPPQPTPPPLNDAEKQLLERVRLDVLRNCVPRRIDLPEGATAGVECRPSSNLVARVGIYQFANGRAAARAYFERLAGYGVGPLTGDCTIGHEGDGAWTPGDLDPIVKDDLEYGVVFGGTPYSALRIGCYFDEFGNANMRMTCGDGVYVGVLGRTPDIALLNQWTWKYPAGVDWPTPTPPGICIAA